jgi:hypothetical protein
MSVSDDVAEEFVQDRIAEELEIDVTMQKMNDNGEMLGVAVLSLDGTELQEVDVKMSGGTLSLVSALPA